MYNLKNCTVRCNLRVIGYIMTNACTHRTIVPTSWRTASIQDLASWLQEEVLVRITEEDKMCLTYYVLSNGLLKKLCDNSLKWQISLQWYPTPYGIIKGIFSDSNNIFLWHESEDVNRKGCFQIFSWFQFYNYQLCMIKCIDIAP